MHGATDAEFGTFGGLGTSTARVPGGWLRWIGCAAVWEAVRAVCFERHLCSAASAATARAARVLTRGTNLSISPQPSVRLPWVPGRAAVQRNRRSLVGGVAQGRIRLWVSTRCVGRQYAAN